MRSVERVGSRAHRRPSPAIVVSLLALCVALGGVAYAAIPGPGGVIKGCYNPTGTRHALSVVDQDADCPSPNVVLPFNQHGAQGAQGPQGKQGPQGIGGSLGPSVAYTTSPFLPNGAFILLGKQSKTLAKLSVPGGSYFVIAKATIMATDMEPAVTVGPTRLATSSAHTNCELTGGDTDKAWTGTDTQVISKPLGGAGTGSATTMTLTAAPEFPPRAAGTADIRLRCRGLEGEPGPFDGAGAEHVKLTAIKLGDVITQGGLKLAPKKKTLTLPNLKRLKRERPTRRIQIP
jgi:hypothetical protein